jgi:hypothetical protein
MPSHLTPEGEHILQAARDALAPVEERLGDAVTAEDHPRVLAALTSIAREMSVHRALQRPRSPKTQA